MNKSRKQIIQTLQGLDAITYVAITNLNKMCHPNGEFGRYMADNDFRCDDSPVLVHYKDIWDLENHNEYIAYLFIKSDQVLITKECEDSQIIIGHTSVKNLMAYIESLPNLVLFKD